MRGSHDVLKKPVFTEKATYLKETGNKLIVEVDRKANKIEIRKAFEEVFKVKVVKVATINVRGKKKKWGRSVGWSSAMKKAVVTLKKGEKLDFIEGV
ncbi:LSU ribosomal protein L23p (L23Ae) [hydrothermal vent metagenome]|uniref:LSU ribosomal protein L23p (L23Ae) n=1 Tax=hydrothermal vent metagenome TaxID=652676 RepID=A0A3B1DHL2_9ZZZZ